MKFVEYLMGIFCSVLYDYTKTDGFKILCLDHDQSLEESEKRLQMVMKGNINEKENK
jgi:hypothetical protein